MLVGMVVNVDMSISYMVSSIEEAATPLGENVWVVMEVVGRRGEVSNLAKVTTVPSGSVEGVGEVVISFLAPGVIGKVKTSSKGVVLLEVEKVVLSEMAVMERPVELEVVVVVRHEYLGQ